MQRMMSVRSALMDIKVPGTEKPLFLMITINRDGDCEGLLPTGRVREDEAAKVAHHVASSIMYRLMFETLVDPGDIVDFLNCRFLSEHAKIAIEFSSYEISTRTVELHHSSGLDIDDDMKDLEEDWIDMSILDNTAALEIGNMDSGILFDHDNDENSMSSMTTQAFAQRHMPKVSGLAAAAAALGGTPQNGNNADATSGRGAPEPASNSATGQAQELPPPIERS